MWEKGVLAVVYFTVYLFYACAMIPSTKEIDTRQPPALEYIRASGKNLVIGSNNTAIVLHGVCFGNNVWGNPSTPPYDHHTNVDFARVTNMKMNVIRFYLNYKLFEEDSNPYQYKQSGWNWLKQNIEWAEQYGVFLILNMHVPQGGFQSMGEGLALWDVTENQNRLTALWKAIANFCKNYTNVAAYDLLNEPVTSQSKSQWVSLANRIVKEIRKVDPNHLIIVERLNAVKDNWGNDADMNFFIIDDLNVAYEFHFYSPIEYTHQLTSWTGYSNQDGGLYPNSNKIQYPSDLTWATAIFSNPEMPLGNSNWSNYVGVLFKVTDSTIVCGKPAFVSANNSGISFFDDFVIKEYDSSSNFIRIVFSNDIENLSDSWFWSYDGNGFHGLSSTEKHTGSFSCYISNTTSDANISFNAFRFIVTNGHYYQINGYMKGISATGQTRIRIDFEKSPSGSKPSYFDKTYLSNEISKYLAWGNKNNVPLYCGEYGVFIECVTNNKGGATWVKDVVNILKNSGVSHTYHSYHESAFGLYTNVGLPKDNTGLPEIINALKDAY